MRAWQRSAQRDAAGSGIASEGVASAIGDAGDRTTAVAATGLFGVVGCGWVGAVRIWASMRRPRSMSCSLSIRSPKRAKILGASSWYVSEKEMQDPTPDVAPRPQPLLALPVSRPPDHSWRGPNADVRHTTL